MDRHQKYLSILSKVCENLVPFAGSRVAAAIVHKNRLISIGTNRRKTDPFHAKFAHEHQLYLHAETSAIKQALRSMSVDGLTKTMLYVCRIKRNKCERLIWGMSKPCMSCRKCIMEYGIKKVIYTIDGFDRYEEINCKEFE